MVGWLGMIFEGLERTVRQNRLGAMEYIKMSFCDAVVL